MLINSMLIGRRIDIKCVIMRIENLWQCCLETINDILFLSFIYLSILQIMDSELSGGYYDSATSSSFVVESDNSSFELPPKFTQNSKNIQELEDKVKNLQAKTCERIVVTKCAIPIDLKRRKEAVEKQIMEKKFKLVELTEEAVDLDYQIEQLEALPIANEQVIAIKAQYEAEKNVQQSKKDYQERMNKFSQEECDTEIIVSLDKLKVQLQLKGKSDKELLELLVKNVAQERERIQKYQGKRKAMSQRLQNDIMMRESFQAEGKRAKDKNLVDDRIKMLEDNIEKVKKMIRQDNKVK